MTQIRAVLAALAFGLALLFPASAQSPISAFPPGSFTSRAALNPAAGGGGTLTFGIDAANNIGTYSTVTSPNVCPSANCTVSGSTSTQYGIGTASSNRVVVVSFGYAGAAASPNAVVSDVKINGTISGANCTGGIQATQAFDTAFAGGLGFSQSVWYAAVPSGTTATVCWRYAGGNGWGSNGGVVVSYLNDSLGAASISVSSTKTTTPPAYPGSCSGGTCTNTWTGNTVPAGGVGIGVGITADNGSGGSHLSSWSGTSSPTKDAEVANGTTTITAQAHWTVSGNVTETVVTGAAAGWAGVIFAP